MRRLPILFTLAFYGFAAMDLHEWARVPQVLLHLLEHHSEWAITMMLPRRMDMPTMSTGTDPFRGHHHEACGAMTLLSIATEPSDLITDVPAVERLLMPLEDDDALSAHARSKWNPPKQG